MIHERIPAETPMGDNDLPFKDVLWSTENLKSLYLLNLKDKSTAHDVRNVAISSRVIAENKGLDVDHIKALKWVLQQTEDCVTDEEFNDFLLNRLDFEEIGLSRKRLTQPLL